MKNFRRTNSRDDRPERDDQPENPGPPLPFENVYEDFKAVEKNLRRYVDYRFADIAPVDGTFYRRHRVEIWGMLVILVLLGTTAYESRQAWVGPAEPAAGPAVDPEPEDAEAPDQTGEPELEPGKPDDPQAQAPGTSSAAPSQQSEAVREARWEKIKKNPMDYWAVYLKTQRGPASEYAEAIANAQGFLEGRVSNLQQRNFKTGKELLEAGKDYSPANLRLGIFEYLLIRRYLEQGFEPKEKSPRVDLQVRQNEYPTTLVDDYLQHLGLSELFGDRPVTDKALQVAILVAEFEAGTRP